MKNILFTLALLVSFNAFSQITIDIPKGWFDYSSNDFMEENLKLIFKGESNPATEQFYNTLPQATPLYVYMKYDRTTHVGVSPTINVTLYKNINKFTLEDFDKQVPQFVSLMESSLDDYTLLQNGYLTIGDNYDSYVMISTFKVPNYDELVYSYVFAMVISDYYYVQISLSELENDRVNFDNVINSIRL